MKQEVKKRTSLFLLGYVLGTAGDCDLDNMSDNS